MDITEQSFEDLTSNENFKKISQLYNQYNIFDCVGMNTQEIKHSNFLSWLFNPKEKHDFGDRIFKKFIEKVIEENKEVIKCCGYEIANAEDFSENFDIQREKNNIDILIIDNENQNICVIENKIYAQECKGNENKDGQLKKYYNYICRESSDYKDYKKIFIFMKPDGTKSESFKFDNKDIKYLDISYEPIVNILKDCIKELEENSSRNENETKTLIFFKDYKNLLERFIMSQDFQNKLAKEIKKIFQENNFFMPERSKNNYKFLPFCKKQYKYIKDAKKENGYIYQIEINNTLRLVKIPDKKNGELIIDGSKTYYDIFTQFIEKKSINKESKEDLKEWFEGEVLKKLD